MTLFMVLSAGTALAGDWNKADPGPTIEEHPPVCYRVEYFVGGIYELQCFDDGKDIIEVQVKTDSKYELIWNNENVTIRVFTDRRNASTSWSVRDKMGSVVTGTLP
jgi:hypothetical protein